MTSSSSEVDDSNRNMLRFLVLGAGEGWHSNQLKMAANQLNCDLEFADYESLAARLPRSGIADLQSNAGGLVDFDGVLTRTMPPGSLEKITFRLAVLHAHIARGLSVVNPPRGLEIAIDKFATLEHVGRLGYEVPRTRVAQSRREAMDAFVELQGDCVIKPLFGGEGRGVMRIQNTELAWYSFATLDQLDAVFYIQEFVPPGGRDTRLLIIGEEVIALRRENEHDFRTNVISGSSCRQIDAPPEQTEIAKHILSSLDLRFAAVDFIDCEQGPPLVLEVNAVPGWRGAQSVVSHPIAESILQLMIDKAQASSLAPQSVPSHPRQSAEAIGDAR